MDASPPDLLERLAAGPRRIAAAARLAEGSRAAAPDPAAGESWTPRQNVAHLVLVERRIFQVRLDQLAAGDEPPSWTWTEPGTSDGHDVASLDRAIDAFAEARAATIARVAVLDESGWRRFGNHASYGRLDVAGLLGVVIDHDEHHRADIEAFAATDHPG